MSINNCVQSNIEEILKRTVTKNDSEILSKKLRHFAESL